MADIWVEFVQQHGDVVGYTDSPLIRGQHPLPTDVPCDNPLVVASRQLGFAVYPVYSLRTEAA